MGNIAEKVFEAVKALPEQQAAEVLDFAEFLQAKMGQSSQRKREKAFLTPRPKFFWWGKASNMASSLPLHQHPRPHHRSPQQSISIQPLPCLCIRHPMDLPSL